MNETIDHWLARLDAVIARGPAHDHVLRGGLAVVIFLAGTHKIFAPDVWAPYLAPVVAQRVPVGTETIMVVLGLTEPPVAALLVFDRWTTLGAAVIAISMAGTVGGLAILWVQTGTGLDVLIRDLGILALASGIAIRSAGSPRVTESTEK